ncbi:MAG: hypothetical protein ACI9XP_000853 [Lentimonas sp.]|jgi:hypothetical protein
MKWIGNRISYSEDSLKSTFIVYPEKKAMVTAMMGAWCAMWLTIGFVMIWAFATLEMTDQEKIITVVFLAFWVYYARRVVKSLFWLLFGKEMLKINETSFTIKKSIKGFGKAQDYFLENIEKIKLSHPNDNSIQAIWENSPWVMGGERLEFEHKGKVVRFGRKIPEKEAKLFFNIITKRIEDKIRKNRKTT